jgi:hypothetical protein
MRTTSCPACGGDLRARKCWSCEELLEDLDGHELAEPLPKATRFFDGNSVPYSQRIIKGVTS